jgi:hypothetical protein
LPSLTRIVTPLCVPVVVGVPESLPVDVLNVAQAGLFAMLNVSGSLLASAALGVKLYAVPTLAVVAGVPVIVGAEFVVPLEAPTVMVKEGMSDAELTPSVTMM